MEYWNKGITDGHLAYIGTWLQFQMMMEVNKHVVQGRKHCPSLSSPNKQTNKQTMEHSDATQTAPSITDATYTAMRELREVFKNRETVSVMGGGYPPFP